MPALRLLVLAVVAVVSLLVVGVFLFWLAVALAVVAGLAALHLVYLPRWSARLGVSRLRLALLLLPALVAPGTALGGPRGAELAGLLWLGGVAAPGLAVLYFTYRLRLAAARRGPVDGSRLLEAVACRACGTLSVPGPESNGKCPHCGAPVRR